MEINDVIEKLVETVRVGKSVQFGEALHSMGFCKDIHSARVQFDKHIKTMEALDKVKKIDRGVWSTKDYRGNF